MKKGFGVLFIIFGILNLIVGLLGLSTEYQSEAFSKIFFGLIILPLGIWMYNSSRSRVIEGVLEYTPYKHKTFKKKSKKKKKKKSEFPLK